MVLLPPPILIVLFDVSHCVSPNVVGAAEAPFTRINVVLEIVPPVIAAEAELNLGKLLTPVADPVIIIFVPKVIFALNVLAPVKTLNPSTVRFFAVSILVVVEPPLENLATSLPATVTLREGFADT